MAWLAIAIFSVAVLYFAIHHSGFRKVVLITLAVIVAAAAAGGGYLYWDSQRQAARRAYAKTLIKEGDVQFYNMTLGSSGFGSHSVKGTVRNQSAYPLSSFRMKVTVRDCPDDKCETIGEYNVSEYGINVPPGQVRSFDSYASFPGMPSPVAMQWYYEVIELEANLQ